jgi:hypothetical protein
MQRGFSALFLLIIAVISVGTILGAFYFKSGINKKLESKPKYSFGAIPDTSEQLAKADKEFINSSLEFKLIYPPGTFVKEDSEEFFNKRSAGEDTRNGDLRKNFANNVGYQPGEVKGLVAVLAKADDFDSAPLQIWVFNNPDNLSIDEWYQNYWYYPFIWGDFSKDGRTKIAPVEDLSLPGLGAKSAVIDYQPGKPKFVYVSNKGKIYLFKQLTGGDQILSSFRFIDSIEPDKTATYSK